MIVVDTNVIGYLFLSSEQSLLAEHALQKDSEWAAPILWRSELRNVMTLYVRKNLITLEQAQRIMNGALELLRGREYAVSCRLKKSWRLRSSKSGKPSRIMVIEECVAAFSRQ